MRLLHVRRRQHDDPSSSSRRQPWPAVVSSITIILVLAACGTVPPAARNATGKQLARSAPTSSSPSVPVAGFPGPRVPTSEISDVTFVRPSSGWGLASESGGDRHVVVRSTDGGRTWRTWGRALPSITHWPADAHMSMDVLLAGNGTGANVADAVVSAVGSTSVLVSSDRLRSWRRVSFPAPVLAVASAPGPSLPGAPAALATGVADQPLWVLVGPTPTSEPASQSALLGPPGELTIFQLYPASAAWKGPYGRLSGPSWTGHSAVARAQLVRLSTDDGYAVVDGTVADRSSPAGYAQVALLQRTTTDAFAWQAVPEPCTTHDLVTPFSAVSLQDLWLGCAGEPGAGNQIKTLQHSTDGGTTWTTAWTGSIQGDPGVPGVGTGAAPSSASASITAGYLVAVVATSATSAYVALGRGGLLHTSDGGARWETVVPHIGGSGGIQQLDVLDPAAAWALVGGGLLWATTDGRSWSQIAGPTSRAAA